MTPEKLVALLEKLFKISKEWYHEHMNNYYALINKMTAKPEKRDEVIQILLEAGKPFDNNPACMLYLVYKDVKDPRVIWVEDLWTNKDSHTEALAQPEVRRFVVQAIPLLDGMPEQIEIDAVGGKGV